MIVRLAGLPSATLEPLASEACAQKLDLCRRLSAELENARSALADRLYESIPGAPQKLRRVLLAARRDCFNGRSLRLYRDRPDWPELYDRSGPLAERVPQLEERLATARSELAAAYAVERERERRHLLGVLEDRSILRGIALASPGSVENLSRLREIPSVSYGRRESRLESTLLRYVTRAAFKLSPYSTLTRLGLALAESTSHLVPVVLKGSGWEERSLLRLKRYVLDQLWDLLVLYGLFRDGLRVELNNTIEEVEPGRYRFLRSGVWKLDPTTNQFRFHLASLVKASLEGGILAWLRSELPRRHLLTYGELSRRFEEDFGRPETRRSAPDTLIRLIEIGALCLLPPWSIHAEHLESHFLRFLLTLPPDSGLARVAEVLRRLVELQAGFVDTETPARSVQEMDGLIDELWATATPLAGLPSEVQRSRLRTGNFYEDVFLLSEAPRREVLQVSRAAVQHIQRSVTPIVRFLGLYNRRHDFLLTLATFMAERWPGRRELGLLELFGAVQPLWREYIRFLFELRRAKDPAGTFNPLGSTELERLRKMREQLWQEAAQCAQRSADGLHLNAELLAAVAKRIPERYAPTVGPCLFLQPANRAGSLWVLNRLYEGTGRYGSRFTSVMEPVMRHTYAHHFAVRSRDAKGDEFLDITDPQGDTLNVHAPQTWRVLELPGQVLDVEASRCVGLLDLKVRVQGEELPPELVDERGLPCRPVHLGGAGMDFVPTPLKILATFGPGEMQLTFPVRRDRQQGKMTVFDRLLMGDLVLLRQRWFVAPNPLIGTLADLPEAGAFEAIDAWRRAHGIPDRVFYIEHIHHEQRDDLYKPQYLDFTSPMLVALFRSTLRRNAASLTFEEMLPTPDIALRDQDGCPWAVELLLEDLAFSEPRTDQHVTRSLAAMSSASVLPPEPLMAH